MYFLCGLLWFNVTVEASRQEAEIVRRARVMSNMLVPTEACGKQGKLLLRPFELFDF